MSKHMLGPWKASLGEVYEVRDAEDGRICIITNLRGRHGLGGRRAAGESAFHARLIAAAPEMYEAISEFVARCEAGEVRSKKTYAKFKAILVKAEGRSE